MYHVTMICNTLITSCLILYSTFMPICRPNLWVSPTWQTQPVVAKVAGIQKPAVAKPTPAPVAVDSMVLLINQQRIAAGLRVVTENAILDKTAKIKACDMADNHYFAHKDQQGRDSWHLWTENGYKGGWAGENLAEGFGDDASAMAKFMASQTHKDNILGAHYQEVGIGRCGIYIVQHYGGR